MPTIARNMRIFINGVDVSNSVAVGSVEIKMPWEGVVSTTMTFFALPVINEDSELHLTLGDGAPIVQGRAIPKAIRSFWLTK
jgi:hypothetical protein